MQTAAAADNEARLRIGPPDQLMRGQSSGASGRREANRQSRVRPESGLIILAASNLLASTRRASTAAREDSTKGKGGGPSDRSCRDSRGSADEREPCTSGASAGVIRGSLRARSGRWTAHVASLGFLRIQPELRAAQPASELADYGGPGVRRLG